MISRIAGLLALASLSVCVQAGQIFTRDALENVLGGVGALEGFQNFTIPAANFAPTDCHTLTNATPCESQTNLVLPGLTFTFGPDVTNAVQWNGPNYLGPNPTKDILSNGSSLDIDFDFTTAINAFGIDLRTLEIPGGSSNTSAVMEVFGKDGQPLGKANFGLSPSSVFAGWQDSGGIVRVELTAATSFSPVIDNLEFGQSSNSNPVPEPSSLLLAGIALILAARRRARADHKRT